MDSSSDNHNLRKYLSKKIIKQDQMRVIDRNATALGVSELQLMEGAGHALATVVRRYNPASVLILCGSGNNGGDGMVAARLLAHEMDVTVCHYVGRKNSSACIAQRNILAHCAVQVHEFRCRAEIRAFAHDFSSTDIIVDALLGTGVSGELREPLCSCVQLVNESKKTVISADLPTPGIHPISICAFHHAKTEDAEVFDIGIPILAEVCTGPGDLLLIPPRDKTAHKGVGGSILVIGGGPYQGAPYLAGLAALRAGADIIRVASPISLPFPDIIHEPMKGETISDDDYEKLISLCEAADVVICGMGLGSHSHQVITAIAPYCKKAVFDADALRNPLPVSDETLYTPHAGEFARITGKKPEEELIHRAETVRKSGIPGVVLLKGVTDIITNGDNVRFNKTGTPAMTTGGTGDVLAGVCGALLTNLPAFEAGCIGSYVTGRAGEIVTEKMGYGLAAQDLLQVIPHVLYNNQEE